MIPFLLGFLPKKAILYTGALSSVNKRAIFPISKKIASFITTKTGLLSEEEAKTQEYIFDEKTKSLMRIMDSFESELIKILTLDIDGLMNIFSSEKEEFYKEDYDQSKIQEIKTSSIESNFNEKEEKIEIDQASLDLL